MCWCGRHIVSCVSWIDDQCVSVSQTGILLQHTPHLTSGGTHTHTIKHTQILSTCTHTGRRYLPKRDGLCKHIHNRRLQQMGCLPIGDMHVCVDLLSLNLCFCKSFRFICVATLVCVRSSISIKHILICIRLYEHLTSVWCIHVWVFVVRAHL